MALTAEQLYNACQIVPNALGEAIVDPNASDNDQKAAAIAYIASDVLPGAISEVSVGLRSASGKGTIADFIACRFADSSSEEAIALTTEGEALFDAAAKSYGRAEVNKVINTDRREYDEDSDQDRKQGDAKLKKLLDWVSMVIANTNGNPLECPDGDGGSGNDPTEQFVGRMQSYNAPVKAVW